MYLSKIVLNFQATNRTTRYCFGAVKVLVSFKPVDAQFLLAKVATDITRRLELGFLVSEF